MYSFARTLVAAERHRDRNRAVLLRIAQTLHVPVETLVRHARDESYPDETAELVRLWFKIRDPAERQRVLEEVRRAADR